MSDHKKEAKAASAAKMQRMGLKLEDGSKSFTDERGGSPFEGLNSGNAGKFPVTPSRFKRGGKVGKSVHAEGERVYKNLGKSARTKKAGGGANMPVPVPPRRDEEDYNPYPYKLTKNQQAALHAQEHPNDPNRLDADYASGGLIGATPAQRKKVIGAMIARKKKEGLSTTPPKGFGVPRDIKASIGVLAPMKKGGRTHSHPDEAEDKKLMHKILKPKAFKAEGGRAKRAAGGAQPILDNQRLRELHKKRESRNSMEGIDNFGDYGRSRRMDSHGAFMRNYHENMKNDMDKENASLTSSGLKRGGRAEKCWGGETKARPHRASGGRAKGKTNVNIIISPQSGQQGPLGAGVGMGMPPVPPQMPPMPLQMPPQGMPPQGMPPGGAPGGAPQLPPQLMAALAARGGAGGPPMGRKTGGRVDTKMPKYQEKDYGSGSGLGRLEKRKWPTADGTE